MPPLTALCLPFLAIACSLHLQVHGAHYMYQTNPMTAFDNQKTRDYKTNFISVRLDHFSYANNQSFRLKYLINDKYWDSNNGPIFLYTGNEGPIEVFCENSGFMWDIAEQFGALLVFVEHRFYGDSLPFGPINSFNAIERLGYLNTQQALADFVELISYLRNRRSFTKSQQELFEAGDIFFDSTKVDKTILSPNAVIAFGGSYGGMLAAWIRMKYPAAVQGSLASSAPLFQFTGMTPCNRFYSITSSVYMDTSLECGKTISASWKAIDRLAATNEGKEWFFNNWLLCYKLTNENDVLILKSWLRTLYVDLSMINYPFPANFLLPLPGYPIKELCKSMTHHTQEDKALLGSVFKGISVFFNYTGKATCLDTQFSPFSKLTNEAWRYQSCAELVLPLCSNGITDIFEKNPWNFNEVTEFCVESYGIQPNFYGVEKTYGGKNLYAASNIIFSNGLRDPWSGGGVLKDISETVRAVVISSSAHHADLMAANTADPIEVIEARTVYTNWFRIWIQEYQDILRKMSSNNN